MEARDYAALLRFADRYAVMEIAVGPDSWLAEKTLREKDLRHEGVVVLGVSRPDGRCVGVPGFETRIEPGGTAIAYGSSDRLCELGRRPAGPEGDRAHAKALARHEALNAG